MRTSEYLHPALMTLPTLYPYQQLAGLNVAGIDTQDVADMS